jgi:histidine triad (HIT) family protein
MQLSPEQQKILEEQKKQCIFCQIIEGKVPTKKVYEDDLVLAILDINPASKGHVLLMPKEHYPIMPLIPTETFKRMVAKTKAVDGCIKDAMLCKETTIFVANGGAAGQQSAHFMLHIIPREGGDGLDSFDIRGKEVPEEEVNEVVEKVGPALNAMLQRNLPALGFTSQSASGVGGTVPAGMGMPQKIDKKQLLQIINSNPQVKHLILEKPDQFKQIVPQHPQLSQLFAEVDIDDIIEEVRKKAKPRQPGKLSLDDTLKEGNG